MSSFLTRLALLLSFTSCAYVDILTTGKTKSDDLKSNQAYNYKDASGTYFLHRKFGNNSKGDFVLKKLLKKSSGGKYLERFVSISAKKQFNPKVKYLNPKMSETVFWLSGKKHKSLINISNNVIEVETSINNKRGTRYRFDITNEKLNCFFSQLTECVALTNFFNIAQKKKMGQMNFNVIWDGFPFFHEQYLNQKSEVVQSARLTYLEKAKNSYKYQLEVDDQIIFYFLDDNLKLKKFYWVALGVSQERI
ncbi:MAG: hypothetical protein CME61_04020 [Halobacteriovoraceae bacterium]|nr:hypothetical protein [Halobacteriovoraceae bacterium]